MAENEQIPQQEQSPAYQAETPNVLQDAVNNAEQSITSTADDVNAAKERQAFEKYVESTGGQIPENFEIADAWFNSLKEAQKNYTQGQQEISTLRQQVEELQQQPVQEEIVPANSESLQIDTPSEQVENPVPETITPDQWKMWSYEVAEKGDLPQETKELISKQTGLTGEMVNDFISGQKAKMKEARVQAADVVGGENNLNSMFAWATQSLSAAEVATLNVGLATPEMQETTLLGLKARYDKAQSQRPINQEPERNINPANVASTAPTYEGYKTMREFKADRSSPRYQMEPAFRQAVDQRIMRTDFNTLQA